MREILGEILLSVAVWVEGLAIEIGGPRVAQSYLAAHKAPHGSGK